MSGRPEILFPLFAGLETLIGVGPKTAQNMGQIGLETPRDLLYALPYSVVDRQKRETIQGLTFPTVATVEVTVLRHQPSRNRSGAYRVLVRDAETEFNLVFFHGAQPVLGGAAF